MRSTFTNLEAPIIYTDGAVSLPLQEITNENQPIIRIRDSDGAITALQAIRRTNVLHIPYFPYGREDKPPYADLATFISALDAQRQTPAIIVTYDPHSEALELLVEQSDHLELYVRNQDLSNNIVHFISSLKQEQKPILVATQKYINFFDGKFDDIFGGYIACPKFLGRPLPILDPLGYLLKPNTQFVILDDICDTGKTALDIAKTLNVSKDRLSLYISHGIFSEGADELLEHYSTIATTNSFLQPQESPSDKIIFYALYDSEVSKRDEVSDSSSEEQEPTDAQDSQGIPPQEDDAS